MDINQIIKDAGKLALKLQENFTKEEKTDGTLVTSADIAVSDFLIEKLSQKHPVLSEEQFDENLCDEENVFVIDPIDGTVSFSQKEPTWTILIALMKKGECVESWVYQAKYEKLFYAKKGHGAYLNGQPIKIHTRANRLLTSPNYKEEDVALLKECDSHSVEFGAALKMMYLVESKQDFYPIQDRWFGVWDLLAPKLILEEAGGSFIFLDNYKIKLSDKKINHPFIASTYKKGLDKFLA